MKDVDFEPYKRAFISQAYLEPADLAYALSRWCFKAGLFYEFYWNAAQCLEKYMKACLLLNGRSAKEQSHNLIKLFAEIKAVAGALIPEVIAKPEFFRDELWDNEPASTFVNRIDEFGNPDNRYALHGYGFFYFELEKLDTVAFGMRRIAVPLDDNIYPEEAEKHLSVAAWLENNPDLTLEGTQETWHNRYSQDVQDAITIENHRFRTHSDKRLPRKLQAAAQSRSFYRDIFFFAERGTKSSLHRDKILALIDWVKTNVRLPKSLKEELETAEQRLRLQHKS